MRINFIITCAIIAVFALPLSVRAEGIVWNDTPEMADLPAPENIMLSDSGQHQYEETGTAMADNCMVEASIFFQADAANPVITIVIDDMGLDRKRTARALLLPKPVTMAYLPYSPTIEKQALDAAATGHALMVHLPMEAMRQSANPGPDYLGTDMTADDIRARVIKNLSAFKGYVGVNNHMGSKLTQDRAALMPLMDEIKKRGVFFLDSKTSPKSVAEDIAREHGIATTHRDVFIDDDESAAAVARQLAKIEQVARRYGSAVAIGHPKDVTLTALEAWLPTLAAKGFKLVDMPQMIVVRAEQHKKPAAAQVAKKD